MAVLGVVALRLKIGGVVVRFFFTFSHVFLSSAAGFIEVGSKSGEDSDHFVFSDHGTNLLDIAYKGATSSATPVPPQRKRPISAQSGVKLHSSVHLRAIELPTAPRFLDSAQDFLA